MTSSDPGRLRRGRIIRLLLSFAMLLAGIVAVSAAPAAAQLPPPTDGCTDVSAKGGTISTAEVFCRASYWYGHRYDSDMTYNQNATHKDWNGSRNYRRDCSGFIDMVWHLNADPNTTSLATTTYTTKLSSWKDLQPGDILDYPATSSHSGHTLLFVRWEDSGKTKFDYYSFGSTPLTYKWTTTSGGGGALDGTPNKTNASGSIDSHSYSLYTPYRYKKRV